MKDKLEALKTLFNLIVEEIERLESFQTGHYPLGHYPFNILLVKAVRNITGCGLKEAKVFADFLIAQRRNIIYVVRYENGNIIALVEIKEEALRKAQEKALKIAGASECKCQIESGEWVFDDPDKQRIEIKRFIVGIDESGFKIDCERIE